MSYFKYENKKIFYKIKGQGKALLLLHGNTMSSKMFTQITKSYSKVFKLILIDFPGHGKSDRLKTFKTDFWFHNSEVAHALLEHLDLKNVTVLGTSGGALAAINLGLEHPKRINYLIADSFEGEYPLASYIDSIESDREHDKKKLLAKLIWFYSHGFDWKKVVDLDTNVNIAFAKCGKSFFHKNLCDLNVPTLLTGSKKDEYCEHLDEIYSGMKSKSKHLSVYLFQNGYHPALLSNKEAFLDLVKEFCLK